MISSLRLILLLLAALLLPVAAPAFAQQDAPETRAYRAASAHILASQRCDRAAMAESLATLEALVTEARQVLRTSQTAGMFARITAPEAQRQLTEIEGLRDAARVRQAVNCPQPAQPQPGAQAAPQREPPGLYGRANSSSLSHEAAAANCNREEMARELAKLEALVVEARQRVQAARAAGAFSTVNVVQAQSDLTLIERLRDLARARRPANCPPGGTPAQPPGAAPAAPAPEPAAPGTTPAPDIMDPNFRDPATEEARDAAEEYEEARQACDDQAMRAARLRLDRLLQNAEDIAAYGATLRGTDARTVRLKEIANNRVRDIEAIINGLGRGPAPTCPPDTATPASPTTPERGAAPRPIPPAEQPSPVPRQRSLRGLFGALGVGWLKEGETDLGFASLGGFYRFGDHFGIEGEAAIGLIDEENEAFGFRDSFGIDFDLAAYATVFVPVGDHADLFARAGYGYSQFGFSLEGPGVSVEDSDGTGSFRYGLGGQLFFDEANGVRVTWTRWDEFERDGVDADVFVISYVRRFGGPG